MTWDDFVYIIGLVFKDVNFSSCTLLNHERFLSDPEINPFGGLDSAQGLTSPIKDPVRKDPAYTRAGSPYACADSDHAFADRARARAGSIADMARASLAHAGHVLADQVRSGREHLDRALADHGPVQVVVGAPEDNAPVDGGRGGRVKPQGAQSGRTRTEKVPTGRGRPDSAASGQAGADGAARNSSACIESGIKYNDGFSPVEM